MRLRVCSAWKNGISSRSAVAFVITNATNNNDYQQQLSCLTNNTQLYNKPNYYDDAYHCTLPTLARCHEPSIASSRSKQDHRGLTGDDAGCGQFDEATWGMTCAKFWQWRELKILSETDVCVDTVGECACTGSGDECFAIPDPLVDYRPYCALTVEEAALENGGISAIVVKPACSGDDIAGTLKEGMDRYEFESWMKACFV